MKKDKASSLKRNKNFTSMEHYRAVRAHIKLSRLTYGIIDGHEVEYIRVGDERIDIKESWIELILFMTANVMENNPKDFLSVLSKNNVTSNSFTLSKSYGKISFDRDRQYKVYKVYNTNYFVEAVFDIPNIFQLVSGLIKICSLTNEEIELGIVSKEWIEKKIDFNVLGEKESIGGPESLALMKKAGMQLIEIQMFDERVGIQSIGSVLWVLCVMIHKQFGDAGIAKLPKYKSTGVSKKNDRDDVRYMQLPESEYFVYTDLEHKGIEKFISEAAKRLEIGNELKFKYREIKKGY